MSSNTTDTAPEKASTDAPPSGRARSRRLITALTILAVLAIGSVALYAISLIVTAVILLLLSALLAYLNYPLVLFFQRLLPHAASIRARPIHPIPVEPGGSASDASVLWLARKAGH